MIKSVHLKNFQAHKDLKIDFTSGVNIIRGSSDAGKSAIIRAMLACITGKDFNAGYQTWNTKGAMEVTINIDGHTVVRGRDAKTNYYLVDGKRFAALRGECPVEVSSLFNMGPDQCGNQYSPFYLISDSSGDVARKIQSICDLDSITKITKAATKQVNESSAQVKSCKHQVESLENTLSNYDSLDSFRKQFDHLKSRFLYYQEKQSQLDSYKQLQAGFAKLKNGQNLAHIASLRPELDSCKERAAYIKTKGLELKNLQKLQNQVTRYEKQILCLESMKNALVDCKIILKEAQMIETSQSAMQKKLDSYTSLQQRYVCVIAELQKSRLNLEDQRHILHDFKQSLGVCPLCGSPYHE